MGTIASWKIDGLYKADASVVHKELQDLGNDFTCEQIVDKARNENTELHKCFEWNDEVAAKKYRLEQASQIVRHLVIAKTNESQKLEKTNIRLFVNDGTRTNTYKSIYSVARMPDEYKGLLNKAYEELRAFKKKYSSLKELKEILELID